MMFNKKGDMNLVTVVLITIIVLFIGAFGILTLLQGQSPSSAVSSISGFTTDVLVPIFGWLLNLDNAGNNAFLVVLTFILMMVIVSSTLDAANIFGAGSSISENRWLNLIIGVIVSIIGVRFMPADVWGSLTAPSSAFVATILVGIPFVALFLISMKIKNFLARKMLWLFYVVFMSYLIFRVKGDAGGLTGFAWMYIVFLLLSFLMLILDGTIRRVWNKTRAENEVAEIESILGVKERQKIRKDIESYYNVIADPNSSAADIQTAQRQLAKLKRLYGNLSVI